jgi:predicted transcriptional regulator of viral defense system
MGKKTLGKVSAKLITTLYEKDKVIFTNNDIENITGLESNAARDLASRLIKREVIARLKPGKYIIIPQELGRSDTYIGNWYVVVREIVKSPDYYVSHYSAMDIHNMISHPLTKVYISTPKQEYKKHRKVGNVTFEFIYINPNYIWGIENNWVTKSEQVRVSNIERTIIDCLYNPKFCGGVLEVVKGLWAQKDKIDFEKLQRYALKFDKINVIKRIGYILEVLDLVPSEMLNKLRNKINEKYYKLDPLLSTDETCKNSWKIIANISPEEMKNAVRT